MKKIILMCLIVSFLNAEIKKEFDKNGNLTKETSYKNGKKDGLEKNYYFNRLDFELLYKDGIIVNEKLYYIKNGALKANYPYKNGLEHGLAKVYFDSGKIKKELPYVKGKIQGIGKFFSKYGHLEYERTYINGEKNGIEKKYDGWNGKLISESLYKDHKKNGLGKEYYQKNGALKYERFYVDGKKEGVQTKYYSNGDILSTITYKNDKKHGTQIKYSFLDSEAGKIGDVNYYINGKEESHSKYYIYYKDGRVEENLIMGSKRIERFVNKATGEWPAEFDKYLTDTKK